MGAFICFMAIRVAEMWRILKPTGSLYLHCDPTASHYLKAMMDAIFGTKNFRNEILWLRAAGRAKGNQHAPKTLGTDCDYILHYAKTEDATFHGVYLKLSEEEMQEKFPEVDCKGRRYNTDVPIFCSRSMKPAPGLCYEYRGITAPHPSGWRVSKEKLKKMDANCDIIWRKGKNPLRKSYAADYKGKPVGCLWTDIPNVMGSEFVGWPTQKPVELYERMIKASSNEGDVVLDPFCGCATTLLAAAWSFRKWIGIDADPQTSDVVLARLQGTKGIPNRSLPPRLFVKPVEVAKRDDTPIRTDAGLETIVRLPTIWRQGDAHSPLTMTEDLRQQRKQELLEQQAATPYLRLYSLGRCDVCDREFDHLDYLDVVYDTPVPNYMEEQPAADPNDVNRVENLVLVCGVCQQRKLDHQANRGKHFTKEGLRQKLIKEDLMGQEYYERNGEANPDRK